MPIDDKIRLSSPIFARRDTLVVTATAGPLVSLKRCAIALPTIADEATLGAAARAGLAQALRSFKDLPLQEHTSEIEANALLATAFGIRPTSRVNIGLKHFTVRQLGPVFKMRPTFRGRGAMFHNFKAGIEDHEEVSLPTACTDAELGAAMRVTLSRCL